MLRSPMEGLMLSIQLLKEKVFAALMKKVCLGVREKRGGGGGACLGFFFLSPAYKVQTKAVILYKCPHFQDMLLGQGPANGSECFFPAFWEAC